MTNTPSTSWSAICPESTNFQSLYKGQPTFIWLSTFWVLSVNWVSLEYWLRGWCHVDQDVINHGSIKGIDIQGTTLNYSCRHIIQWNFDLSTFSFGRKLKTTNWKYENELGSILAFFIFLFRLFFFFYNLVSDLQSNNEKKH